MSQFVTLLTAPQASTADAPVPLMTDAQGADHAAASVAAAFGAALVMASQTLGAEAKPAQGTASAPTSDRDAVADGEAPLAGASAEIQTPPSVEVTLEHLLNHGGLGMPWGGVAKAAPDAAAKLLGALGEADSNAAASDAEEMPDTTLAPPLSESVTEGEGAKVLARPKPAQGPSAAELVAQFVARAASRGQVTVMAPATRHEATPPQVAEGDTAPQPENEEAEGAMGPNDTHGQAVALAGLQAPPERPEPAPVGEDLRPQEQALDATTQLGGPAPTRPQPEDESPDTQAEARNEAASEGWVQATAVAAAPGVQAATPAPESDVEADGAESAQTPATTNRAAPQHAPAANNEPVSAASPARERHERAPEDTEHPLGITERRAPEAAEGDQKASPPSVSVPEGQSFHAAMGHAQAPDAPVAAATPVAQPIQVAQVSQELGAVISQGARRVQLRVSPEGLGELDVQIRMHRGEVHLTIRGDAPELAQALSQQVHGLRQDLDQQGLTLGTMDFGSLTGHTASQEGDGRRAFDAEGQRSSHQDGDLQRIVGEGSARVRPAPSPAGRSLSTRVIDVVL